MNTNLTGAEVRAGSASWRIELNFSLKSLHCGSEFYRKRHPLLYELYISLKEYLLLWTLLVWSLRGCNVYKNLSKIYNIHPLNLVLYSEPKQFINSVQFMRHTITEKLKWFSLIINVVIIRKQPKYQACRAFEDLLN